MNYRSGWKMTTESNALKPYWQNDVGGAWCDGGAGRITIDNPASGEAIAERALSDNSDVDRAIGAARACHESGVLTAMRFGPVLSLLKFRSDDEAIEVANATEYGLVSGVFTRDLKRALRAAQRLRAGQVFVNEWYAGGVETPFGGYGKSGYGRERGHEALWNYVQTKNIAVAVGGSGD